MALPAELSVVPSSALLLVAVQDAWWRDDAWLRRFGRARGDAASDMEATFGRVGGVLEDSVLRIGVPAVHVELSQPTADPESDSPSLRGLHESPWVQPVSRVPSLVLERSVAEDGAHDLASAVPGLCQWIEHVLLESGISTLVLAGATLTGFVHRMAVSLHARYGSDDARSRRISPASGRRLPVLRVVVDAHLCGDFAEFSRSMCGPCLTQWERNNYVPRNKTCPHAASSAAASAPASAVSRALERLHASGVEAATGFDWTARVAWRDDGLADVPAPETGRRAKGNAVAEADTDEGAEVEAVSAWDDMERLLSRIEGQAMAAAEAESVRFAQSDTSMRDFARDQQRFQERVALRSEDADAGAVRDARRLGARVRAAEALELDEVTRLEAEWEVRRAVQAVVLEVERAHAPAERHWQENASHASHYSSQWQEAEWEEGEQGKKHQQQEATQEASQQWQDWQDHAEEYDYETGEAKQVWDAGPASNHR